MHFSGDSMSKSIRMHPLKLYTGPRPCGELWSPCIFLPRFLFQQSYSTSTSSPFTSICIFHYQLQFRDYGGSLAHRLQLAFSYLQVECTCLELKGPGHFSQWHHSISIPAKLYTCKIFSIFHSQLHFRDYGGSLAHRFQLRFTLFQLECTCLVLLDLSACTFLPSDIIPFPGS